MRKTTPIPVLHPGLLVAFLLALLALSGVQTQAAPAFQGETPTAGIKPPCAIEGYVFDDLNRDQVKQGSEPGLATVQVDLLTRDAGEGDPPLASRTTNADGFFCFESGIVEPGTYRLVQQKVPGYETTGGQVRFVTVNPDAVAEVFFANIRVPETATPAPTFTPEPPRPTPTGAPTFTSTPTFTPSPTLTLSPSVTLSPSATGTVTSSPSPTTTATPTLTPTQTRTPTPTSTLRSLTPIATFITTTPGVLVTTTRPPGQATPTPSIDRLPDTGSGSNLLLIATACGLLMLAIGLARRLFFSR